RLPRCAHETWDELGVVRVLLVGSGKLFVIDIQDGAEFEILQELFEFFIDLHQAFLSIREGSSRERCGAGSCVRADPDRRGRNGQLPIQRTVRTGGDTPERSAAVGAEQW